MLPATLAPTSGHDVPRFGAGIVGRRGNVMRPGGEVARRRKRERTHIVKAADGILTAKVRPMRRLQPDVCRERSLLQRQQQYTERSPVLE
eukprot:6403072-Prymnesium_polylepis.2